MLTERHINLTLSDATKEYLAKRGYDPVFGARPLKRTIQRDLQDPLARYLLEDTIREGETVYVHVDSNAELTFTNLEPEMVR